MTTPFSALLIFARAPEGALRPGARLEGQRLSVSVPDDWSQGRSVFGGLQVALALRSMRALVPETTPIRTLQTTFIAPCSGELEIESQVLRVGKSATHVEARIFERGTLCAIVIGVFGEGRPSVVSLMPTQEPVSVQQPIPLPFMPGITPNFVQHFDARLLRGAVPFVGMEVKEAVYELDLRDMAAGSECSVVAVADFPPPLGLSHLKRPAPGSTLTWMLEFLADSFDGVPLRGFRLDVRLVAARDGYTSQSVMVWGANGVPLALSTQNMLVFG